MKNNQEGASEEMILCPRAGKRDVCRADSDVCYFFYLLIRDY